LNASRPPFFRLLLRAAAAWSAHRGASKGAALAFYALFSIAPILLLITAVAGYFFGADAVEGLVIRQIDGQIGANAAQLIQNLLAASGDRIIGITASAIAVAFVIIGATSVFAELKNSLDEIWERPPNTRSPLTALLGVHLLAFVLVLFLALLLIASLLANALFGILGQFAIGLSVQLSELLTWLSSALSFALIACLFAVIFKLCSSGCFSWRSVWAGSLFTTVLFSLGKYAIGQYLSRSGVTSVFGAAGSLIALLLWIYYSAQIFFLGAAFTRQYALSTQAPLQQPRQ
jgi:membrane protein